MSAMTQQPTRNDKKSRNSRRDWPESWVRSVAEDSLVWSNPLRLALIVAAVLVLLVAIVLVAVAL